MALFELTELASWVQSDLDTASATLARTAATAYLEAETGVRLTQQADVDVTYTVPWDSQWVDLPIPTTAVSAVLVDGVAVTDYVKVDNRLYRADFWGRDSDEDYAVVEVTMTYGFATPPAEFKHWGLVLATQVYQMAPKTGLQSFRIDDYSETYATTGSQPFAGLTLPAPILGRLRSRYGRGATTVNYVNGRGAAPIGRMNP